MKVVAHLRRLGKLVSSPHDAWLLARMLGWSLVLPLLKRALPLPTLVGLMRCKPRTGAGGAERVGALSEWAFRSRPRSSRDNCLDRALVAYRYLGREGASPTIVIGVAKDATNAIAGHVWVTVDGEPVHDEHEFLAGFTELTAFGSDGRVLSTEAASRIAEPSAARTQRATPPPAAPPR